MRQLIATLALLLMPALAWADGPMVGDAVKGEQYAKRCVACHSVTDSANKIGPSLVGIYGSPPGTADGFMYSDGFRQAFPDATSVLVKRKAHLKPAVIWDEKLLDQFLADPKAMVPHNKMVLAGIQNPHDRADIIAYLKTLK